MRRHTDVQTYTHEPRNLRVGFEYFHGYSHPYTISANGEITLGHCSAAVKKLIVKERTMTMVKTLENHCANSSNITIHTLGCYSRHFCPFSGGGDIEVFTQSAQMISAAVVTSEGREDEEELPVNRTLTPPPSDDSQNTSLVCYGILLGPMYPLKLLKPTLDFSSRNMYFEELYTAVVF